IGGVISFQIDRGSANERCILDVLEPVLAKIDGKRADDRIDARAGVFHDGVFNVVNKIDIIAIASDKEVDALPAVQPVASVVADQSIAAGIASRIDIVDPDEENVLDVGQCGERKGDRALNNVSSLVGGFRDDILRIVDNIKIVPQATDQRVSAETAIEDIVAF